MSSVQEWARRIGIPECETDEELRGRILHRLRAVGAVELERLRELAQVYADAESPPSAASESPPPSLRSGPC